MPIREIELVEWIRRAARRGPGVLTGIGDDAAVLDPGGGQLCATTDAIVEGVDFQRTHSPLLVGRKAANINFSDLAAMGARPRFFLAVLCLPRGIGPKWAKSTLRGILAACRDAGASLVGGDLSATTGPATIVGTALGSAPMPVLRSGALPGDAIGVTGRCGGSILGRHLSFTPRWREGLKLAKIATAMIDVSDGLAADLGHILEESGVGAEIKTSAIPVHPDARREARVTGRFPVEHALRDGEDFELVFTCDGKRFPKNAFRIGTIVRKKGLFLDGRRIPTSGFEHLLA